MASELKVDKFTGVTTAGSILVTGEGNSTTTNLQQGLCKFWIQFNGTSTVATRDSFNLASLTDNATGDYTHTFTNAFSNNDYAAIGMAAGSNHSAFYNADNTNTTTFRQLIRASGTDTDTDPIALQIAEDLA
jgi:hypothetical protein